MERFDFAQPFNPPENPFGPVSFSSPRQNDIGGDIFDAFRHAMRTAGIEPPPITRRRAPLGVGKGVSTRHGFRYSGL